MLRSSKNYRAIIKESGVALFIAKINPRFCLMLIASPFISAQDLTKFLLAHGPIRISDSCASASSSSFYGEITRRENIAIVSFGAHSFPATALGA